LFFSFVCCFVVCLLFFVVFRTDIVLKNVNKT